jgi:hypothetical protein
MFIEFAISKGLLSEQRMPQGPLSLNLLYQLCRRLRLFGCRISAGIPSSAATGAVVYCNVIITGTLKSLIFA